MKLTYILTLPLFMILAGMNSSAWAVTIAEKVAGMTAQPGYFTTYWDDAKGEIYVEITEPGEEFIYYTGLPGGLGSNDIGLDRGQIGESLLVRFEKIGEKVLLRQINLKYRATSDNDKERQAVEDAFASSVIGGFTVAAQTEDRILINFTDFLLADQHGIAAGIARANQGNFAVDAARSAVHMPRTKSFPHNTEFEAILTLTAQNPGNHVRDVAPQGKVISLRQHISFVKLPEPGFDVRPYHVNSGYFADEHMDYAAAIEDNITTRHITRHRLEKQNPGAAMSAAKKPIIYYLDPGVPEPIRGALMEGAGWWNQAFEFAGYKDAFQVKLLPEGADPMDVRYNIINWVHRKTRGWSYGWRVADPRTGEILKGHVTLGSLRVRQDFLLATALMSPYDDANADVTALKEMALARIRQLSAHEVGHTLGLAHNFTTSSKDRASVMDYPHPLVTIGEDDKLDLTDAYSVGIGQWDKFAIRYGYAEIDDSADKEQVLAGYVAEALAGGLEFISDPDSRNLRDAHAGSHLWDGGDNPVDELTRLYEVRRIALGNFSEKAIPVGAPLSSLEEVLVPLYYLHRYQLEAAGKSLGGVSYSYAVRNATGQVSAYDIIAPEEQARALAAILGAVDPAFLALPETILRLIPPKAYGYALSRESFPRHTGKTFDAMALAEAAAGHVMTILLHPERAARITEHHARDARQMSFAAYLARISGRLVEGPAKAGLEGALHRRVGHVFLHHLMLLEQTAGASAAVRATAHMKLVTLEKTLRKRARKSAKPDDYSAHYLFEADRIAKFLKGELRVTAADLAAMPPGSPI